MPSGAEGAGGSVTTDSGRYVRPSWKVVGPLLPAIVELVALPHLEARHDLERLEPRSVHARLEAGRSELICDVLRGPLEARRAVAASRKFVGREELDVFHVPGLGDGGRPWRLRVRRGGDEECDCERDQESADVHGQSYFGRLDCRACPPGLKSRLHTRGDGPAGT